MCSRLRTLKRYAFHLLAISLLVAVDSAAAQVQRLGSYSPPSSAHALRATDADDPSHILLIDENYRFAYSANDATFSWNRAYVTDGPLVHEFDRNDFLTGPLWTYDAGAQLLDVETGSSKGELLLLTTADLLVLDAHAVPAPRILTSASVENLTSNSGNLLSRFGDTLYVADNTLRGFRVFDVSKPTILAQVAQYASEIKPKGKPSDFVLTDLQRDGALLSLVIGGQFEVIRVDNPLHPSMLTSLGNVRVVGATRALMKGGFAFVIVGRTVRVLNVDPTSSAFLAEVTRFEAAVEITDVEFVNGRLYLLCGTLGFEIWDVSSYAK